MATAALLSIAAGSSVAGAQQTHLLIVTGLGGERQYVDAFYQWGVTMFDAAHQRLGVPRANIQFLAENPARDQARISGPSRRENVAQALKRIASAAAPGDQVLILLIGHGGGTGPESRVNLPGPDYTATEYAEMLAPFSEQRVGFVVAASASGDFLPVLSAKNRVIITATKTGFERNESMFGKFFVEAFATEGADTDKDGRVSLLEAFEYARASVQRAYEDDNRLLTEHAMLDDDGDAAGTMTPDVRRGDGVRARTFALGGRVAGPVDPRVIAMEKEKGELEEQIEALRRVRDTMPPATYEARLETLLVDLALLTQRIRAITGGGVPR
jgi:hypothetical protein